MGNVITAEKKLHVHTLGWLELETVFGTLNDDKARSGQLLKLLAYFLLHRSRKLSQQELIDILWGNDDIENPLGALKNLVYRMRTMLKPISGGNEFFLTGSGAYYWNPEIAISLDLDHFEDLCKKATSRTLPEKERIDHYRQAVTLYDGDFLPKIMSEHWAMPIITHYHSLYLSAVKTFAEMLSKNGQYEEIENICTKAIKFDQLDDKLHYLLIMALARQGKQNLAIDHYNATTELLYDSMGVRPSETLRELYKELIKSRNTLELDLGVIQKELAETAKAKGAFICEYGIFKEIYRLQARQAKRFGMSTYVALITCTPGSWVKIEDPSYLKITKTAMAQLKDVLISCLRQGDIASKYSGTQYVILLPTCTQETGTMVMERIFNNFYKENKRHTVTLSYRLAQLILPGDNL